MTKENTRRRWLWAGGVCAVILITPALLSARFATREETEKTLSLICLANRSALLERAMRLLTT